MSNILDLEPDTATQLALLHQEVNMAVNTRWQISMRHRVNKRIGNEAVTKQLEIELEQIEKYLSALDAEVKQLTTEK